MKELIELCTCFGVVVALLIFGLMLDAYYGDL